MKSTQWIVGCWLIMCFLSAFYVIMCPYTKVEESFNIQATHDHIHYTLNIAQFDHQKFPGPIPRTFVGSLLVGYASKPIILLLQACNLMQNKVSEQHVVRGVLAALVMLSSLHFLLSIKRMLGVNVAVWTTLISCSQFHYLFYTSRTLPNTFAVITALLGISYWLRNNFKGIVFFGGFSIIVFRAELAIIFGLILLMVLLNDLYHSNYSNVRTLPLWITLTGMFSLGLSVLVDTYYWGRLVWPEGEAFVFNAIEHKSSQWGTSPLMWYFYSALPRAMGLTLLLVPIGMKIDGRCFAMAIPALGFVLLYSLLPHKELRFIIYVVPLLNVIAARACVTLWLNRTKGQIQRLLSLIPVGHLLANLIMTGALLAVSYYNYPGGEALAHLNNRLSPNSTVYVHIDEYSAQTGVTLFLHEHDKWRYDKTEDPKIYAAQISEYTHLLVGTPDEQELHAKLQAYAQTHRVLHQVDCFKNIQLAPEYPFVKLRLAPCVWVIEKKNEGR